MSLRLLLFGLITSLACASADGTYWVDRSDTELYTLLAEQCAASLGDGKPVLITFSASWCPDCQQLNRLSQQAPMRTELAGWHPVVVNVGDFDRHVALMEAFGVPAIPYMAAMKPTDCSVPPQRWPRLRVGNVELSTADHFAGWLVQARGV
jgi:thiol-disulfide isomerase/thioredoxin